MPLKDWSTTAASNTSAPPNGWPEGMTIANVNNCGREMMAATRNLAAEDTIASAATCDLGTKDATFLTVSGTTTITGFGTVSAGIYKFVRFSGALTLTHNATSLILLSGANRTTVAGDCGLYKSEGSGNWREYFYSKQTDYQPLDAQLTTLAGITEQQATDLASVSAFIGTLLNDVDAATARTTLGVTDVSYASSAENAAGTIENKAVDPLGIREAFNATGTAPVYACRAWVNFNGTGTVAIRAAGNVGSITDNGVGSYNVNFTTSMPDVNYSVFGMGMLNRRVQYPSATFGASIQAVGAVAIINNDTSGTAQDDQCVNVGVFR